MATPEPQSARVEGDQQSRTGRDLAHSGRRIEQRVAVRMVDREVGRPDQAAGIARVRDDGVGSAQEKRKLLAAAHRAASGLGDHGDCAGGDGHREERRLLEQQARTRAPVAWTRKA